MNFNHFSKRFPETNDISFESPNIELLESEIKMGVASSGGLPHPPGVRLSFEGDYLSRATNITGITVHISISLTSNRHDNKKMKVTGLVEL